MSKIGITDMNGYLSFPRQKLSDSQKNDEWYKANIDFAENLLQSDTNLRNSFKNKQSNYNLRNNIINIQEYENIINPDKIDLKSLPASFQHIGIENTKINLLIGEYINRKKDHQVHLSQNDADGISRKEKGLMDNIRKKIENLITHESISQEEVAKELEQLQKSNYEYQDIAEITANRILKKEYKDQNFDFLFSRTWEDLLVGGEQIVYCGVLGRKPIMRRVDTMNLYTIGGNSMFIEDSDIIVEFGYKSVGNVIDDYWDVLTEADIEFLESGKRDTTLNGGIGLNRDMSIFQRYGEENAIQLFNPNETGIRTFAGAFDTKGNVRELKVAWRSRRKIGELTYFDEDGQEQKDWVPETYKLNKDLGETVRWFWVNEWLEATKIGDHIYTKMRPLPFAGKSLTNKSYGTPPFIGSVNATNGNKVQSLSDIMKPLAISYDVAYYKRELAISTYKGSFAAINSSLIPSGWEPEDWIRYVTVNKFGWLDPTNEIRKGPSQGKSAGNFNNLTAQQVQMGDPNEIQMYTNLLVDIENTLGKVAGVSGAREGQIQSRQAVGNTEREVSQTSQITEKWFNIDANFRKRALSKFLEVCKYAYKKYPIKGQFVLDDMGMEIINEFDEFCSSEFDLFVSDSREDTELYADLKALMQPAIQNGQATIADVISLVKSESTQELSKRLESSARKIKEETEAVQKAKMESDQKVEQMKQQAILAGREFEASENEKDRQLKREMLYADHEQKNFKEIVTDARDLRTKEYQDSDKNGIDDFLDIRRTDIDENYKQQQIKINEDKLEETKRTNRVKEEIARKSAQNKTKS